MTQSLAGIEPVKVGRGDDVSLDLSERTSMTDPFASLPDPVAAERFQSAMADSGAEIGRALSPKPPEMKDDVVGAFIGCVLPEERISVGRDVPITPQDQDEMPVRQREDTPLCQSEITPAVVQKDVPLDAIGCALPGKDVSVGRDVPIAPQSQDGASMRRREDAPPYQSEITPAVVQKDVPLDAIERVLPEKGILAGRDVPVTPQNQYGVPMRQRGDAPLYQSMIKPHEMSPDSHEPVQVIAPAPLPIELPAATVQQQPATAVATPDVVRMFVAAAEAVADAILVSSGFENGEGRILVRLQPEVLGGSEVQINAKGGTLTVVVNPASQDVQTIVEANRTQFEQHLAEKVHSWRVAVTVKRGEKTDERV